jgi:hypothetical protein
LTSQLYPKGAGHILGAATQINFTSDTIKILFYASTFNSANEFVSDLTGASIVARSAALSGKTVTNGTFSASNLTITSVSGSSFSEVVLYKDTGADATSPLIAIFDVTTFFPTGGDINVVFNAAGLFAIA